MSRIQQLKNQLVQAMRDELARVESSIAQARDDEKQAILRMEIRREKQQYKLQQAEARFAKAQRRFEQEQRLYQQVQLQAEALEDRESDLHEYYHQQARALQNQHQDLLEEVQRLGGSYPPVHQPVQPALDQDAYHKLDLLRKILKTQSRNDPYDNCTLLTMYQTWRDTYQAPPKQNRYQNMLVFVQHHSEAFPPGVAVAAVAPVPAVAPVAPVAAAPAVAAVSAEEAVAE